MYRKDFSNLHDDVSNGCTIDCGVSYRFNNSVTDVEGDRLHKMCQPAICPHNTQPTIAGKEFLRMSTSLDASNNGRFKANQSAIEIRDDAPDNTNLEPSNANQPKTPLNQEPGEGLDDYHDETTANPRATAPNIDKTDSSYGGWQTGPIPFQRVQAELQQAKVQLAKQSGDIKENRETIEALRRQLYQIEQQRQIDRIDDNKRQHARELQMEERLKRDFAAAVRPAVEEIIPQRDRSRIPEPARQPMNPPMPIQRSPGRVEAIAGGVPRLVMYGLVLIFSFLSIVFLVDSSFLYSLLEPTRKTLSILLSIIIVSGGVILLANSWE